MKADPRAASVIRRLDEAGYASYLVGGCVRDALLGKAPKDWDVATAARPEQVLEVFSGCRVIETGLVHGTVTVLCEGLPVEVTTFRVDGDYEGNRRPKSVAFVSGIEEDLARRDFTINALAYHPAKGLIDLFGGAGDIEARRLRSVGDPDERFREDGLRILRALRFASVLSFDIDEALGASIRRNRGLLGNISAERILSELTKLLTGGGVRRVLAAYPDVLAVCIPELAPMVGFDQRNPYHMYDVWMHTAYAVEAAPEDGTIRLAMLLHDIGKPSSFFVDEGGIGHFYGHEEVGAGIADRRLRALKCDNGTREAVCALIRWHDVKLTERNLIKWLNRLGEARLRQLLEVQAADAKSHTPDNARAKLLGLEARKAQLEEIIEKEKCFSLGALAVNGTDLIAIGIPEGSEVGRVLNDLLDAVMDEQVPNEKQALLRRVWYHVSDGHDRGE